MHLIKEYEEGDHDHKNMPFYHLLDHLFSHQCNLPDFEALAVGLNLYGEEKVFCIIMSCES